MFNLLDRYFYDVFFEFCSVLHLKQFCQKMPGFSQCLRQTKMLLNCELRLRKNFTCCLFTHEFSVQQRFIISRHCLGFFLPPLNPQTISQQIEIDTEPINVSKFPVLLQENNWWENLNQSHISPSICITSMFLHWSVNRNYSCPFDV